MPNGEVNRKLLFTENYCLHGKLLFTQEITVSCSEGGRQTARYIIVSYGNDKEGQGGRQAVRYRIVYYDGEVHNSFLWKWYFPIGGK